MAKRESLLERIRAMSKSRPSSSSALASPPAKSPGINSTELSALAILSTLSASQSGCHQKHGNHAALWLTVAMNEKALRQLQEADQAFHLHPFTNHREMHAQGTHVIVSAEGCHLTD